jgi:predicted amino acid dehydrogenase
MLVTGFGEVMIMYQKLDFTPSETTKANQCRALLNHLYQFGNISTIQGREKYGIYHVAGRVHDLRKQGVLIQTRRVLEADASGRLHGVALYVLKGGAA